MADNRLYVEEYAAHQLRECINHNSINPALFSEYGVKRGLRDKNGKGVLAGLTNISLIQSRKEENGQSVPCDGRLLYRGYDSLWICVSFYAYGICQKAHGTGSNAGDVIHGFFHPSAAGRAAHAGYGILFHKHQCLLYFISFCRVFISSSIT